MPTPCWHRFRKSPRFNQPNTSGGHAGFRIPATSRLVPSITSRGGPFYNLEVELNQSTGAGVSPRKRPGNSCVLPRGACPFFKKENKMIQTSTFHRPLGVRASTLDEAQRSVDVVIATETPVPEFDRVFGEVIPRVLLASGAKFPKSRQVPLIDTHDRRSIARQIGSVREIRIDGGQVVGRLHVSQTAEDAWALIRDGHLTDVSAGFSCWSKRISGRVNLQKLPGRRTKALKTSRRNGS